jgi:transcription antitermination factor NusG
MRELCPDRAAGETEMREAVQWFALTVRHQHERQIEGLLRFKGLETMVPVYRARRTWSDRVKEIDAPLFAGYVLCRFNPVERLRVVNTPGVVKIVGFGAGPVPLDDAEIEEIRRISTSGMRVQPWPYLKAGDRVRVERGPLRGLEGILLREPDGLRLVACIELLRRSVAVELDPDMIAPVSMGVRVPTVMTLREAM